MSVYVPIYHRILYGSSNSLAQEQCEQDLSKDKQGLPMDKDDNLAKVLPETRTKQTMSAPLLTRGKNIGPRLLSSAPLQSVPLTRSNGEHQSDRWKESERNLSLSRTLKRTSNIIPHRQDQGYSIIGSSVPLVHKYDIDEEELIKLRMLAHSRAEKSTRTSSVNSSTFQRRVNSGIRGQNSSPILPETANETEESEDHMGRKNLTKEELRQKQREMKRMKEREKEQRLEEKAKFEKEMEERYKRKKLEHKSMIFVTENNHGSKQKQRVFLTESDFMDEEKAAVYSFINEKQRNAFTSIFNDIDKSKDGKVDMDELKQQLFPLVSKKNLKYLLQVFDLDKDNTVDLREFVTICALNDKLCGIRTESETASLALDLGRLAEHITIYKELFNVVDEDGDGRLQADEVLLMVTTATEGETDEIDVDESKRVLDNIEKDENGFIDFVSFLSYIPFFAKLLKVIMDSPLSIASLERVREKVTRKYSRNAPHSS